MIDPKAIVIETARRTAGIAVRDRDGFHFFASDALFYPLDNQTFSGLRDLWAAIDRVAPGCLRGEGDNDE